MPLDIIQLQNQLDASLADVVNRLNVATDEGEINSLTTARDQIQTQIDLVNQQGLLAAAGAVATAVAALQDTIATARTDPVGEFVNLINGHLNQLGVSHAGVHADVAPSSAPHPPPRSRPNRRDASQP
jgi:hypothetical protein